MRKFDPRAIRDASDLPGRIKEIEARLKSLETSSGLDSASFSGTLRVAPGGQFVVDGGADITMNGGGELTGRDGAGISMMHAGTQAHCFAAGTFASPSGVGYGMFTTDPDGNYLLGAAYNSGYDRWATMGDPQYPLDSAKIHANRVDVNAYGTDGNGWVYINPVSKQVAVNIDSGAAAPVHIDGAGRLWRNNSSRRYKQDIEDADTYADSVLKLRPRRWRYIAQVAEDPENAPTAQGFIAEEVEEAGLDASIIRTPEGAPEGLDYNAILMATVELCQRQQEEINELRRIV